MKAMIFAAGLGTRLKPLTDHMPKALVPVNGRPMLEHVILKLKQSGFNELVINIHHFGEQIIDFLEANQNFGLTIHISDEREQLLDTGGGIKKAAPFFQGNEPFLIHNVDILSDTDLKALYESHLHSGNDATLLASKRMISTVVCSLTGWARLDGIMGVAVAAFILWSGWGLVMDTLSPLLGESPSPELVEHIEQTVMGYPGVLGMHDLMVHDYGPGHQFASLHIEFPAETDPLKAHDVIDNIENDFIKRDGLQVTIHYDPIVTTDAAVGVLRTRLMEKARQLDPCLSIHDLRIVPGDTHTNVLFDLEFPAGYTGNKDEMLAAMCQFVHEQDPKYSCVVKVEQSYASAAHEK